MRDESLPHGWSDSSVGGHCTLLNGLAFKPEDWSDFGLPIIRIQNLNGSSDFNRYDRRIAPPYIIEEGKLLFSWSGNRGTSFGPYRWPGPTGILNQHIFKVTPQDGTDSDWFFYALEVVREQVERAAHGGLGLVHVRRGDLLGYRVPTPPLPEQRRIAEILDTLDEAIRKTEQVIAKLQQMKQGLLHDLLTRGIDEHGELRDPERHPEQFKDSPLGRIPRGWEVVQAGEHVNFNGGFGFPHVFQGRHTGELPFYKVSDQSLPGNERWLYGANNYVSRSLASRQGWRPAPAEGVAFAKVGAALLLNRRRILTRDSLVDNNMMVAVAEPDVAPAWLYWWLTTVDFGVFVQPGALPSVNQGQLNRLELALPGLAEQTEIGRRLNAASVREVEEEKGLDKLRTLKHGLMDDLLTGRVRVTVPLEATA